MTRFGRFTEAFVQSFLARLREQPAPAHARHLGPCQIWTGAVTSHGYGHLSLAARDLMAHAVGFELYHGRPPRAEVIRHLCGIRLCCNGAHHADGTHAENLADAVAHGTHVPPPHPCGSAHPSSKLDDAGIAEVKRRLAAGETQQQIADDLGVSQPLVSAIANDKARTCRRRK